MKITANPTDDDPENVTVKLEAKDPALWPNIMPSGPPTVKVSGWRRVFTLCVAPRPGHEVGTRSAPN